MPKKKTSSKAVKAVDFLNKLAKQTVESVTPPTTAGDSIRMLNPTAGRYGMGKFMEDAGQKVGAASDAIYQQVEDTQLFQNPHADSLAKLAAYLSLGQGHGLTPSSLQQTFPLVASGAEAARAAYFGKGSKVPSTASTARGPALRVPKKKTPVDAEYAAEMERVYRHLAQNRLTR